jgi:hypothetical protein
MSSGLAAPFILNIKNCFFVQGVFTSTDFNTLRIQTWFFFDQKSFEILLFYYPSGQKQFSINITANNLMFNLFIIETIFFPEIFHL